MQFSKSKNNNTNNGIDFKFHCQVGADSPDWVVLRYLRSPELARSFKEMILRAGTAYWQALADRYLGGSQFQCQQSARNCIYRLQQHLNNLREIFGVTRENSVFLLGVESSFNLAEEIQGEDLDFEFRYQVSPDSPYWGLLSYFQSKDTEFSAQEMILWSCTAYWQAIAYKHLDILSGTQLKQSARNCICRLQQHIHYLGESFNLESSYLAFSSIEESSVRGAEETRKPTRGQTVPSLWVSSQPLENSPPPEKSSPRGGSATEAKEVLAPALDSAPGSAEDDELIGNLFK